jgi:hypothetical protein
MMTDATRPPEPAEPQSHAPKESQPRAAQSAPFAEVLASAATAVGASQAGGSLMGAVDGGVLGVAQASLQALLASPSLGASLPRPRDLGARTAAATDHRPTTDPLDPASRQAAQMAPPLMTSPSASHAAPADGPVQTAARASLETVLPALVRRIAWAGDGRKGSLRLEFGAGVLAGGTLVVHSDDGRVRVELQAPSGTDATAWRERIVSRLEARQLDVEEVEVR